MICKEYINDEWIKNHQHTSQLSDELPGVTFTGIVPQSKKLQQTLG